MKKLAASSIALVLILAFCSCDHNVYQIRMKTNGEVLERTVTVYRVGDNNVQLEPATSQTNETPTPPASGEASASTSSGQFPKDRFDAIQKIYGKPMPTTTPGEYIFVGKFTGRTPQDIGGSGHYFQYDSDMGAAKVYTERFRGSDDLAAIVERQSKSADAITDMLIGWAKAQMKDEPRLEKLVAFLNGQFRHDLKSLALYTFVASTNRPVTTQATSQATPAYTEILARGLQYLADRDYFQPGDVPRILRSAEQPNDERDKVMLTMIQRLVADKLGVPANEPTPKSLSFFATTQSATKSLEDYLGATPQYKQILKEWETTTRSTTAPATTQPTPWAVLDANGAGLVQLNMASSSDDVVRISLATTTQPYLTNGEYDPSAGEVNWAFTLKPEEKDAYAPFCYAYWGQPHEAFQKAHFGAVVLTGESLWKYCMWYKSLTPQELARWQEFAGALKPGRDLPARLRQFRLHPENAPAATIPGQAPTTQPNDYATEIMDTLAAEIEGSAATQPATASGPTRATSPTRR
jgi:hypothetical protein